MDGKDSLLVRTTDIVAAYVGNNVVSPSDIGDLIGSVYASLAKMADGHIRRPSPAQTPAVSIRASINPDHLVCLEDGAKVIMLKRYISTRFGLTPDDYRAKWNLPGNYPMIAPNYAARRRDIAKDFGLGKAVRGRARAKPEG